MKPLAAVRGAGDLASAVGRRLHLCGFSVVHLETASPTVIRRAVAFASAVYDGSTIVEGVEAALAGDVAAARALIARGKVAVLVDPEGNSIPALRPVLVVDAILAKRNVGTHRGMAPRVVALGPGFTAGVDAHAVVETCRGHDLGRVILSGSALPDTGIPGSIEGHDKARLLRAPRAGSFRATKEIGDLVKAGDVVADVVGTPIRSAIDGIVRGLLHDGLVVSAGQKVGDVDPRGERRYCFTISDKANAVAGGVLEAALCDEAVRTLVAAE
ncbi:MAG: selenium-dependent molybdenum cofactor biosynthesis protein YqeB [Hyphomicrobiales bacterium]